MVQRKALVLVSQIWILNLLRFERSEGTPISFASGSLGKTPYGLQLPSSWIWDVRVLPSCHDGFTALARFSPIKPESPSSQSRWHHISFWALIGKPSIGQCHWSFRTLQQCIIKGPGSLETWFAARLHFTFWDWLSPFSFTMLLSSWTCFGQVLYTAQLIDTTSALGGRRVQPFSSQYDVWKQHSWQPQKNDSRTEQRHCKNSVSRNDVWLSLLLRRDTFTEISHGWPRRMRLDDVGSAVHQSKWHNLRFRQGTERDFYIGHAWFSSAVSVFALVPVFAQTGFSVDFRLFGVFAGLIHPCGILV